MCGSFGMPNEVGELGRKARVVLVDMSGQSCGDFLEPAIAIGIAERGVGSIALPLRHERLCSRRREHNERRADCSQTDAVEQWSGRSPVRRLLVGVAT
jgi:hypothetical protein